MSRTSYLDSQQMASFLFQYMTMLEMLMSDLRKEMRAAVDEVMDQVNVLDSVTASVANETGDRQAEILTKRQDQVDQVVMSMMGILSSGDVIRQQVDHLIDGFEILSGILNDIVARKSGGIHSDEFKKNLQRQVGLLDAKFTMESEHACLKAAFSEYCK